MHRFRASIRLGGATAFCLWTAGSLCAQEPTPSPPPVASATPTATIAQETTASLTAPPTSAPAASPKVLYPATNLSNLLGSSSPAAGNAPTTGGGSLGTTFVVLVVFCGAGYYLLKRHPSFAANLRGTARKLTVSESRSLGNRQFLVVVEYENERMLLGVTPGKIDYLCPLRGPHGEPGGFPSIKEAST